MKRLSLVLLLVVLFTSIFYIFSFYPGWIISNCVDTFGADTKLHLGETYRFIRNFEEFGFWYPVNFFSSSLGTYWEDVPSEFLPLPAILNLPLAQVIGIGKAFHLSFLISFILVIVAVYFFMRKITSPLFASIISIALIFLPYLNKPFAVGGNYLFLFSLPLFFLSLTFFYEYLKSGNKKYLVLMTIFAIAIGFTYIFTLFFLISFYLVYSIIKKRYDLIKIIILILLATSVFTIPAFANYDFEEVEDGESNLGNSFKTLINVFKPQAGPFVWLYSERINKNLNTLDTNHGLGIIVLILLSFLFIYKKEGKNIFKDNKFVFFSVLWLILLFWTILISFSKYLGTFDPPERIITLFVLISFLFSAYVLYKIKVNYYSSLIFLGISLLVLMIEGSTIFPTKIFLFSLVVILVICGSEKRNELFIKDKNQIIIPLILIFLLFFPITANIESSTDHPRNNFFLFDDMKSYMGENDTFLFVGGWANEFAISSCTSAKIIYSHRHLRTDKQSEIIGKAIEDMKNGDYDKLFSIINKYNINKLVFDTEFFVENGIFKFEKMEPLIDKLGEPRKIISLWFESDESKQINYAFFSSSEALPQQDYDMEYISPIKLKIEKKSEIDNVEILVSYNKHWKSDYGEIRESEDGLVKLTGVEGKSQIELKYDVSLYWISLIISIIAILGIIKILYKRKT